MSVDFPLALVPILGGIAAALLPVSLRRWLLLALPCVTFYGLWLLEPGTSAMQLFGFELQPMRVDRLSRIFGYIFCIAAFIKLGEGLVQLTGARSVLGLTLLFAVLSCAMTQVTSNTASATMCVPVAISVAGAAGVSALEPALAACLGAGMGCMLPVSTPPNAIVYGSGCVPLLKMVRHGFVLGLVGVVLITVVTNWLVPWIF
jgi:hypothetical protein